MNNNQAIVAYLKNISKIEGADRIVKAWVTLNNIPITSVVVGVDTQENTPIIYFDSNLCLDPVAVEKIDKVSVGYGQEGFVSIANYLAKGNRIRCIKLKKTISNGLAINVEKFYQFFKNEEEAKKVLIEGYSFTEIDGQEICKKWLPPAKNFSQGNKQKGKKGKATSRVIPEQFKFHYDTLQLKYNIHVLEPDNLISLSSKIHGTSAICSNAQVKRKLSLRDKIAKFLGVKVQETEYDYLYASRTVVKNDSKQTGFYSVDIWTHAGEKYFKGKLHPTETVYYEVVGYLPGTESMIQKKYDYGAEVGDYKIAVYRITTTNPDGNTVEYSWDHIRERCKEMDVPMVKELYYGKAKDLFPELDISQHWKENFLEALREKYLEGDDPDCKNKVPFEGVVLKIHSDINIPAYKLKSERFFLHENEMKEKEELDIEEQEGVDTDV